MRYHCPDLNADALNSIAENIRAYLDAKHRAREQALALTREVIRLSANAIRNVHRRNFDVAEELLRKARANLDETETLLSEHRDIGTLYFLMSEDNVRLQLKQPWIKIGTDATGPDPDSTLSLIHI